MNLGERIKARRNELNLTLLEVANYIGVREATMQRYESGAIKNLKYDKMIKLAEILETTPGTLVGWDKEEDNIIIPFKKYPQIRRVVKNKVPKLGKTAAGVPMFDEYSDVYEDIDSDIKVDFCLDVVGDSMSPRILNGDVVFFRQQSDVENGQTAVVDIDNEVTLKRVYKQNGIVSLVSDNPTYPLIVINKNDFKQVRILGLAIAYKRKI